MAKAEKTYQIGESDVKLLIEKGKISSELELERASLAARFLRLESQNDPKLAKLEKELSSLIRAYESEKWSDFRMVTENQMKESKRAEKQASKEFKFYEKRKELIVKKLKDHGLNQSDLANILAHSKSYTSEILNGVRTFAINDLIIVHRLFNIQLEDLVFTEISTKTEQRIAATLEKVSLNTSKSKNQSQVSSLFKALYS